ncbi:MAG: prepilin-type N-terminal cleavage/methylation domain-containing protein [Acidobacteriia bacterium]|nr:prepilin-type N-terminal cleavage/methylation domain-containing protein [Terriglobia bacterium]
MRNGKTAVKVARCRPAAARNRRTAGAAGAPRKAGFTLLELMIVIGIIAILAGIAVGSYRRSVQHAREAALKSDLQTLRQAIEQYTIDKQAAPQSLEDMVAAKYLREIPTDPITRQKNWRLVFEDVVLSPDQATTGLTDVFSSSDQVASDGTPYSTW